MTAHSELLLFSVQNGCAWNIMLLGCCDSIVWWVWPQRGGGGQLQGWAQVWHSGIEGRKKEAISWRSRLPWLSVGVCAPPSVPTYCGSLTVKVSGNLLHTPKVKECVSWLRWKEKINFKMNELCLHPECWQNEYVILFHVSSWSVQKRIYQIRLRFRVFV